MLSVVAVVAAGLLAGLGAGLGARSQGVDVDLPSMLGAALNVVPTALVALGVGAVVLAWAPRRASAAVYAVVVWSLVIDLLASLVARFDWLDQLSLFHYMALAPADGIDARTVAVTTIVALALGVAATIVFHHRDVQTG